MLFDELIHQLIFEVRIYEALAILCYLFQKSRVDREMLRHKNDIFNCEVIYVAQKTSPPRSDLVELLRLCGAITVNSAAKANIIITPFKLRPLLPGTIQVNEKWVLDSIQEYMVQPKLHYSFDTT